MNFFAAIVLVALIASSSDRNPVSRRYSYFLLSITAWSGAYFLWRISEDQTTAEWYCQILITAAFFIPITFYQFAVKLAGVSRPKSIFVGYASAIIFMALVPFGLIVDGVSPKAGHSFWPNPGLAMPLYLAFYTYYVTASGWTLWRSGNSHLGARASDYFFVLISGGIGFAGGATNFPLWYDIPIQPYGNILVAVYIVVVGYGLYSKKVPGISLNVYKALVGLFVNVSFTLFYMMGYLLYVGAERDSLQPYELWSHGLAAFFVSSFIFWGVPKIKKSTEKVVDGVFRREHVSAMEKLKDLPSKVAHLVDLEAIAVELSDSLQQILEVTGVAIYREDPYTGNYQCSFASESLAPLIEDYSFTTESPIITRLIDEPKAVVLDQVYADSEDLYYQALVDIKNKLHASVLIPVFAGHEVFGLILIGDSRDSKAWSVEEITSLFNLGAQLGLNLRIRDFERRSNEVDKLVALGTMAASLSHEIRNPLVSVQTLASLLKRNRNLEEMPAEYKEVLIRDIQRIKSIVDGVASYSRNPKGRKSVIKVGDVIDEGLMVSKSAFEKAGVKLSWESCELLEKEVYANQDQLVQVLNNLFENSVYALRAVANPMIALKLALRRPNSRKHTYWIEIEVADNGPGIPVAIYDRIFDPFITSKDTGDRQEQQGMGLGLAISKRIIESHRGAISVSESEWGGAKFSISLKVFDSGEA